MQFREIDGRTYMSIDLSIEKTATYRDLSGEWSPNLQAPWSAAQPNSMEVLSENPPGTEQIRFEFAAPEGSPTHFLRLRIEP